MELLPGKLLSPERRETGLLVLKPSQGKEPFSPGFGTKSVSGQIIWAPAPSDPCLLLRWSLQASRIRRVCSAMGNNSSLCFKAADAQVGRKQRLIYPDPQIQILLEKTRLMFATFTDL